jgi:hypothetical protein
MAMLNNQMVYVMWEMIQIMATFPDFFRELLRISPDFDAVDTGWNYIPNGISNQFLRTSTVIKPVVVGSDLWNHCKNCDGII